MFNNLTKFDYVRNKKEAFGFYLAYLFLGAICGGLAALIFANQGSDSSESFNNGMEIGIIVAPIYCLALGFAILRARKERQFSEIILIIVSAIISYFFGVLIGLIPLAYLTTKNNS